jgi:acetyl esterase/lipase
MSLYPDWFPTYLLEYAHRQEVAIISADTRLMPESTGLDILDDLVSFWEWLYASDDGLQSFLNGFYPTLQLDTTRILAEGESAGGYLVVQAALSGLPGLRAVISAYPMLDLRDRYYTERFEKVMTGVPMQAPEIITEHLASMKKGEVVSKCLPPSRGDLSVAIIQQGRYVEFLGEDDALYPVERLKLRLHAEKPMPRLWIYHGRQDTGIPAVGSEVFVNHAAGLWPPSELRLHLPDGEHGLHKDKDLDTTDWLRDGVEWIEEAWLGP